MTRAEALAILSLAETMAQAGQSMPAPAILQLVEAGRYLVTHQSAERMKRHRGVTQASHGDADVTLQASQAAALGRGVGGMGVVAVEVGTQKTTNHNSNTALQKDPPSLDDLISIDGKEWGKMTVTHMRTVPASVQQAQKAMVQRMEGVARVSIRRKRHEALVEMVFGYWTTTYGKPSTVRLSPDRERVILRALEQNDGNLSELFYALDGARKDDWIMGRDPRSSTKYDTPETILRDRGTIERHASRIGAYGRDETHPQAALFLTALADTQPQLAGVA